MALDLVVGPNHHPNVPVFRQIPIRIHCPAERSKTRLTPERNITFLAFLISRPAVHTVRRAFPLVRIVTAALDPELVEVHFPLLAGVSGEAAGDAEYASRVVARAEAASDVDEGYDGEVVGEKVAWVVRPGMGHIGDRYYLT